jgi:large conductance mechanosensitive channel
LRASGRTGRPPDEGIGLFFFVIKPVNALLSRMRTEPPVAEETHQCPECLSDIPVAARRCAFCTTQVSAAR